MKQQKLQPPPLRVPAYVSLLAVPPLIALVYIGIVLTTAYAPTVGAAGVQLSPITDPSPLIISLTLFIIGYCVFIGLIFKDTLSVLLHRKKTKA